MPIDGGNDYRANLISLDQLAAGLSFLLHWSKKTCNNPSSHVNYRWIHIIIRLFLLVGSTRVKCGTGDRDIRWVSEGRRGWYHLGYPGGAVLHIYDALYKEAEHVNHILVRRNEQAAVHAAEGYADLIDLVWYSWLLALVRPMPSLVLLTRTWIVDLPLVVFTGQVPRHLIGNNTFKNWYSEITRPCVKHNFFMQQHKDLATTIKKAFYIASTGRAGQS